jgi:hypothetical protein
MANIRIYNEPTRLKVSRDNIDVFYIDKQDENYNITADVYADNETVVITDNGTIVLQAFFNDFLLPLGNSVREVVCQIEDWIQDVPPPPPEPSLGSDLQKDYFDNLITVTPYDQVEVRFDKADYADFINETTLNGGSVTQSGGVIVVDSGSNISGKSCLESLDNIEYRPGNEIYVSGTAVFSDGGIANNIRRVGMANDVNALDNSVTFGYEGTSFNIRYTSAGVEVLNIAQSSWDDPCDGSSGSKFTGNVYRIIAGLFGFAGWIAEIFSPDGKWVEVYTYRHNNNESIPVFESNSFKFIFFNENNGNTTPVNIRSQCWNGGTNSTFDRINSTLTERTLAQTVRSVITGETSAGGGAFVNVKVSPSGSLEVNASQDTHDDLNTNANLQVNDVDVSGSNPVPVDISSIGLPTGASTEAKQDDQITVLNSILSSLGGAVEGEESEKDLLRQLIVIMKFQTEEQIRTNNLLKLILS